MNNSWPNRYEVTFESIDKESYSYNVCTWQSEDKAVALSAVEHCKLKRPSIYKVSVNLLGRSPKEESGVVKLVDGDLMDRMEW